MVPGGGSAVKLIEDQIYNLIISEGRGKQHGSVVSAGQTQELLYYYCFIIYQRKKQLTLVQGYTHLYLNLM